MNNYREIIADPKRVYVVGDLHGCIQELSALLKFLDEREKINQDDLVVFIGDYIDRGPNSKAVIDQLIQFKKAYPGTVLLGGNHEVMMFTAMLNPLAEEPQNNWLKNGGFQTLASYGVPEDVAPELIIRKFQDALPKDHKQFFDNLEKYVVFEDYCFVHAGVNPLRDLRAQLDQDIFWIRQEFISNIHYFKKTVIFGHTPFEDVMFHMPYKIGIDTGCVFGNQLSAIELKSRRILQIKAGSNSVLEKAFPAQ